MKAHPTLSAAVGVNSPYQDDLGGRVRHIGQDAENIERRHGVSLRGKGTAAQHAPRRGLPVHSLEHNSGNRNGATVPVVLLGSR
jgi:hypothetical protein